MKERFVVEGLGGKRTLVGEIEVKGAKNAALKFLAASILFDDEVVCSNVPDIEDVVRTMEILSVAGAHVNRQDGAVSIRPPRAWKPELDPAIAKRIRASIVLAGPMLARAGEVKFPFPGGDVIGERPIDLFLSGFEAFGAEVEEHDGQFRVRAPRGGLRGAHIFFPFVSVTATETLMMAAALAHGDTILENAAMEPEIVALAAMLAAGGADIEGVGTPVVRIRGTGGAPLCARGQTFAVPPDRIEAGSFIILAALAGKDVTVRSCNPKHLISLLDILSRAGVPLEVGRDFVRIVWGGGEAPVSVSVRTHEYPGFATDLHPIIAVFLTQTSGEATILETIWDGRFRYAEELARMGADMTVMNPHKILIRGPRALRGAELESPDIRAGLAYLLAATVASGMSIVNNAYAIDRGYERIEERLQKLGLSIRREKGE